MNLKPIDYGDGTCQEFQDEINKLKKENDRLRNLLAEAVYPWWTKHTHDWKERVKKELQLQSGYSINTITDYIDKLIEGGK